MADDTLVTKARQLRMAVGSLFDTAGDEYKAEHAAAYELAWEVETLAAQLNTEEVS